MLQDFQFAWGQAAATLAFESVRAGDLRVEHGHSSRDAFHGADQIEVNGIFQNVAARARFERLAYQRFFGVHAEH